MREINLRDQSHASRSWGPEISRFGVDYVRLSIWIQHLFDDEEKMNNVHQLYTNFIKQIYFYAQNRIITERSLALM